MIWSQGFSAIGMGLLLGILLGLSSSSVVAVVVGALAAMLSAFLDAGGQQKSDGNVVNREARIAGAVRNGLFGFACTAGIALGIYTRTHDLLSPPRPTLAQQVRALETIGFTAAEARRLAVGRTPGDAPAGMAPAGATQDLTRTVLFGVTETQCQRLDVGNFATMEAVVAAYGDLGETRLQRVALAVRQRVPGEAAQMALLAQIVDALCRD